MNRCLVLSLVLFCSAISTEQVASGGQANSLPTITSSRPYKLLAPKEDVRAADNETVDYADYIKYLNKHLKKTWHPPKGAPETIRIHTFFTLDRAGNLHELSLGAHSNHPSYEKAALEAVRQAAPFKPLPAGSPSSVNFDFTFDFVAANAPSDNFADQATSSLLLENLRKAEKKNDSAAKLRALFALARYEQSQNRTNWAIEYYEKSISLFRSTRSYSKDYSQGLFELAQIYLHKDEFAKAEPLYRECLTVSEGVWSVNGDTNQPYVAPERGRILCQLAFSMLYSRPGREREAIPLFDRIIVEAGKSTTPDKLLYVDAIAGKAQSYLQARDYNQALPLFHGALSDTLRFRSQDKANIAELKRAIASCYFQRKEFDNALAYYQQAERDLYALCAAGGWPSDLTNTWTSCNAAQQKIYLLQEYEQADKAKALEKEKVKEAQSKAYAWLTPLFSASLIGILLSTLSGLTSLRKKSISSSTN